MKKRTIVLIIAMLVLLTGTLAGCDGSSDNPPADNGSQTEAPETDDTQEPAAEETAADGSTDWRQFLADYEAWTDKYVALVDKYNEDPTDKSLEAEATEMAQEGLEWQQKMLELNTVLEDLDDQDERDEFEEEFLRISQKISDAMASLTA